MCVALHPTSVKGAVSATLSHHQTVVVEHVVAVALSHAMHR